MYKHFFKRLLDFFISAIVLLIIWPILLLIAIFLHFANRGAGAFFTQPRPGKNGKIFKVIKFKTMTDEKDANGKLLPDAQRLTKVGKFIRSTSLDELPQLINVLKGDMALIECVPESPAGRRFTAETQSAGRRSSNLTCGMSTIAAWLST